MTVSSQSLVAKNTWDIDAMNAGIVRISTFNHLHNPFLDSEFDDPIGDISLGAHVFCDRIVVVLELRFRQAVVSFRFSYPLSTVIFRYESKVI